MSTTKTEKCMIENEIELTKKIDKLRERLTESRLERREIPKPSSALEAAQEAYEAAQAKVDRLVQEKADAKSVLASLNARLDAGDETVSVDEIVSAEKSIERAERLLKPAEQTASRTERALKPLLSDEHLAYLTADALESITDVPVVVCKVANEAPAIEPLIIVSQTKATDDYGTLDASGEVRLTAKGTEIDVKALRAALEETGSEVSVTRSSVSFDRAAWPTPRLSNPSLHALADLMLSIERGFKSQVVGGSNVQRLVEAGYQLGSIKHEWSGMFKRGAETLEVTSPGEAVGTATFVAAIQHDRGSSASVSDIKAELDTLISTFQREAIGGWSEAGEIKSIELVEVNQYRGVANPWSKGEVTHLLGEAVWPMTAEAVLQVTYAFEEAR